MNNSNNNISRNNVTTQACAACKYQRRKCGPSCILAPYFPHDCAKQFLNAHKLFGVGKISNMIKNAEPHLRDATMRSIIFQSDMRAYDPVGGCYRHILNLQSQLDFYNSQLHFTLQQLAISRQQQCGSVFNHGHNHHYDYDNGMINNDGAHVNVNGDDSVNDVIHYQNEQHMFDDQQMNVNVSVDQSELQMQMQPMFDINQNYVPSNDDFNLWMNSIPPLSPVKEEEEEDQHEHENQPFVDDSRNISHTNAE